MTAVRRPKILFLCGGNSARSQMAEALLQHLAGDAVDVVSAGVDPRPVHPLVPRVLAEVGVPFDGHAKSVKRFMGRATFAFTITVCEKQEDACPRMFPGSLGHLYWPLPDPSYVAGEAAQLAEFRRVRDLLDAKIRDWWPNARGDLRGSLVAYR